MLLESPARLIGEGPPIQSQFIKNERGCCFFKYIEFRKKKNHKAHKETETWPKFRTLETNPNEMEIYDLTKN